MPLTIKVGDEAGGHEPITMELVARKTIDGNIIICDHKDVDVVLVPGDSKIIAFPKKSMDDSIYATQNSLFEYLSEKGIIKRESVKAGDAYASLEAEYPEAVQGNTTQLVLFSIGKWIQEEKPVMEMEQYYEEEWEERLTDPEDEDSTELGEVPHKPEKGTIDPSRIRRYLSGQGYYEE